MSKEGEPEAKRQKVDDSQGLSVDTDLEVDVEGETFHVHSLLLMLSSPVFRQMLSHDMREKSTRHIELKDKKKKEFKIFLEAVQPFSISKMKLTAENALFLSRWSDEYQVEPLKEQCEQALMKSSSISIAALVHAVECNLPKRKAQCMKGIADRLEDHIPELKTSGPTLPAPIMQLLWPSICKFADVGEIPQMPEIEHIRHWWPFIVNALGGAALRKQVGSLRQAAGCWPLHASGRDRQQLRESIDRAFSQIQL